jgi:hypothetical protein
MERLLQFRVVGQFQQNILRDVVPQCFFATKAQRHGEKKETDPLSNSRNLLILKVVYLPSANNFQVLSGRYCLWRHDQMRLKRTHILLLCLFIAGFGLFQQSGDPATTYHDHLGFSLLPGANSHPATYCIVRKFDDPAKQFTAQNISKNEFISIAYGWGNSSANPKNENLFTKFEVAHCGYIPDTVIHHRLYKGGLGCNPLDDLWRLAYSEYPYGSAAPTTPVNPATVNNPGNPGPGWARSPFKPSEGQIQILQSYGAETFIDVIYGDDAFHLLHDMQDLAWVTRYQGS